MQSKQIAQTKESPINFSISKVSTLLPCKKKEKEKEKTKSIVQFLKQGHWLSKARNKTFESRVNKEIAETCTINSSKSKANKLINPSLMD